MRKRFCIGLAIACTWFLAFGLVSAAIKGTAVSTHDAPGVKDHVGTPNSESWAGPLTMYQRLSLTTLERTWVYWNAAHGYEPETLKAALSEEKHPYGPWRRVDAFGAFYIRMVWLISPLIGLGIFCGGVRYKIDWRFVWRPVAIAIVLGPRPIGGLLQIPFLPFGAAGSNAATCVTLLILMLWSIGAIHIRLRRDAAISQPLPATT